MTAVLEKCGIVKDLFNNCFPLPSALYVAIFELVFAGDQLIFWLRRAYTTSTMLLNCTDSIGGEANQTIIMFQNAKSTAVLISMAITVYFSDNTDTNRFYDTLREVYGSRISMRSVTSRVALKTVGKSSYLNMDDNMIEVLQYLLLI